MIPSVFLLALLACASVVTAAAPPKCDASTLPTTLAGLEDPGQEPVAYIKAAGIRLYDCSTGTPSSKSGGLVNITAGGPGGPENTSIWSGPAVYPDANGNGTFIITDSTDGSSFNLTLNYKDVLFIPAPDKALDWARWTVFSVPEDVAVQLNAGWGSRVDTVGGVEPLSCARADADKQVTVPYTATYLFYSCPEDAISAATPPAPSSSAAKTWTLGAAAMAAAAVLSF